MNCWRHDALCKQAKVILDGRESVRNFTGIPFSLVDALPLDNISVTDERRRYYRLTDLGRSAFLAELQRYNEVVAIAQSRRLLPNFSAEQA